MRTLTARIAHKYIKTSSDNLKLHIFDFDNTLFRSPEPPKWWDKKRMGSWFAEVVSLSDPFIPINPGSDYWFNGVVASAKKSIASMDTFAIMCTGRPNTNGALRYRVAELLKVAGLDFDEVHLNPAPGGSTSQYKAKLVFELLKRYPNIKSVSVWEDTQENLDAIHKVCNSLGIDFHPILITPNPYPIEDKVSQEEYEQMRRTANRRYASTRPNVVDAQQIWEKYGPSRTALVCTEILARGLLNTGLGFIKDEHSRIKSLPAKKVREGILDYIHEEFAMMSEAYQGREEEMSPLPWDKAENGRISVTEVVSPRTGVRGWKITLQ